MYFGLHSLRGTCPSGPDIAKNTLSRPAIISPDRATLHSELPVFLKRFATASSWSCLHIDEILQGQLQKTITNLYLHESLLRSHDPNFIFQKVRNAMAGNNYFAFRIVTAENIKVRLEQKFTATAFLVYYTFHFLFRRVLPKLKGCRKLCRWIGVPIDVSKAEIMGRLIYKGFDIVEVFETSDETIIVTKVNATNNPSATKACPNEGFLFRMQRIGQYGETITVYKFRSMHPYAEYVQAYLHKTNGVDIGGKFKDDFRVSTGGKLIRKYWIDELPMLFNLLKGDIKLIGVRPLSEHYFSLYPPHAQQIRRKHKPGLLPPFYADLPTTFDEIINSEMSYLSKYEQNPFGTDLAYLKKILVNILVHKARSK